MRVLKLETVSREKIIIGSPINRGAKFNRTEMSLVSKRRENSLSNSFACSEYLI